MQTEQDLVSEEMVARMLQKSQAENPPDELTKRLAELVADLHCK